MKRIIGIFNPVVERRKAKPMNVEKVRAWNHLLVAHLGDGLATKEAQRLTNLKFGYPATWSPGQGQPESFRS